MTKIPNPGVNVQYSQSNVGQATVVWSVTADDIFKSKISSYQIYLDGTLAYTASSGITQYQFSNLSVATHTFGVKAISSVSGYDSDITSVS